VISGKGRIRPQYAIASNGFNPILAELKPDRLPREKADDERAWALVQPAGGPSAEIPHVAESGPGRVPADFAGRHRPNAPEKFEPWRWLATFCGVEQKTPESRGGAGDGNRIRPLSYCE
jgi:hypothetical protein